MKVAVILKWSEGDDKWHMVTPCNGKFIYDFFDCENFNRIFDNPDKNKDEMFVLDVHRYGKEKEGGTNVKRL